MTDFFVKLTNILFTVLIQSVWIGWFVFIVVFAIVHLFKLKKVSIKSNLYFVAIMIFAVLVMTNIFSRLFLHYQGKHGLDRISTEVENIYKQQLTHIGNENILDFTPWIESKYDQYLKGFEQPILILYLLFLIYHIGGFIINVRKIQFFKNSPAVDFNSEHYSDRIRCLSARLDLKKAVTIKFSTNIKSPFTMGIRNPVIIFPVDLISKLDEERIDAILMHELAHIKRNDYLTNYLVSFIRVFFFFNPFYCSLVQRLSNTREMACDELVISRLNNRRLYIDTLVFCEKNTHTSLGLAFHPFSKSLLYIRVKHLLEVKSHKYSGYYQRSLGVLAVLLTVISTAKLVDGSAISMLSKEHQVFLTNAEKQIIDNPERINLEALLDYLGQEQLIENPSYFTLKLTNLGLYINGDKQSSDIHADILQKFVRYRSKRLNFTYSINR
tara:strand:- start:67 stop:1386 length:1320 start_codon:yes stop_codon:yes gene_type:complete